MFTGKKVSTFQERFSQLVDESGKSLLKLSKELHISNQALSTWRTGIRSPKEPTIISVANYFGVNVQWLMGFDVVKPENLCMRWFYCVFSPCPFQCYGFLMVIFLA